MPFTLTGVCHLLPLPAGPRPSPGFAAVRQRALADAQVLADAGWDAVILENFGDAPFSGGPVAPHVVAFVAELAATLRSRTALQIGINLLRNDAFQALGVAAAIDAHFVRVNVHTGAMLTDQGVLTGDAHRTLCYRQSLGAQVRIVADVLVKHAVPLAAQPIEAVAEDCVKRGGADGLIVTGEGTGKATDPERVRRVRAAVPGTPVWLGSGVTLASLGVWRELADGAIIGTAVHEEGDIRLPLDPARARAFVVR